MASAIGIITVFCAILLYKCPFTKSELFQRNYNRVQQVDRYGCNDFVLHRQKGTFQHKGNYLNSKSLKTDRNMSSGNKSASVNFSICLSFDFTFDCAELNIKEINSSWFPDSHEAIFLNHNLLTHLRNSTFAHLTHLTHLDVSHNDIMQIEVFAFEGLSNLEYLSLCYNAIPFNRVSDDILRPLIKLTHLNLMQNPSTQKYDAPGSILRGLTQLQNLVVSTVSYTLYFESDFKNLTSLENLEIFGSTRNITAASFENLKGLKELALVNMTSMNFMDENVFAHFTNLTTLKLYNVNIDLQRVFALLWPFKGRNMSEITFDSVTVARLMPNPMNDGFITKQDTKYLTEICVDTLTISWCNIYYITSDAFINIATWNRCLRHVIISGNQLIGSSRALFTISLLENLSTIVINQALRPCQSFDPFPHFVFEKVIFNEALSFCDKIIKEEESFFNKSVNVNEELGEFPKNRIYMLNDILFIYVSKSLETLDFKRLVSGVSFERNITIIDADKLRHIDVMDCGFHNFIGYWYGLSYLKTIIMSGNDVSILSEYFFDGFTGLENLACSKCQFNRDFFATKSDRVFQNNRELNELDLSDNSLNALSQGTFFQNTKLIYLTLSGNQFKEIPFNLKFTPNLKILNISNNGITSLTTETTISLDVLHSKNKGFQLMLNGNILSCGCHDLSFLQWLKSTLVSLDNNRNYTCINKDGERTNTLTFSDLESFWRQCWGEFFFYIALITLCLYIIGVVVVFLMLKNKNFIVSYFLQILGNFKLHTKFDYNTDVYIGYSEEDYRFPCNELRELLENDLKLSTFIVDRDLLASKDKASGIVDAINSCWRVLLVCSKSFLQDEDWSMFTMRSAMYAQSPANPARIVLMVHRNCLALLPTELLSVVNDENIIVVSEWKLNYTITEKLKTRLLS